MANYYALVSGLPNISVEQRKLPFTQKAFTDILEQELTPGDLRLLNLLRYESENRRLLSILRDLDKELEEQPSGKSVEEDLDSESEDAKESKDGDETRFQLFSTNEIRNIVDAIRRNKKVELNKAIPPYIYTYLTERYKPVNEDEDQVEEVELADDDNDYAAYKLSKEDRLSALYYEYAMKESNDFVHDWFKLNLNLRNVLAVFTTRKLGWETKNLIVGDSFIENQLRTSTAKDFGLAEELPYLNQMISIAEEQDISKRERDLDLFRWRWLEDECFDKVFSIERVLSYYIQLGIIERWVNLNEVTGEKRFRDIVYSLKSESRNSLEEFKKKQQK